MNLARDKLLEVSNGLSFTTIAVPLSFLDSSNSCDIVQA